MSRRVRRNDGGVDEVARGTGIHKAENRASAEGCFENESAGEINGRGGYRRYNIYSGFAGQSR